MKKITILIVSILTLVSNHVFAQKRPVQVEISGRKLSEVRTLLDNSDMVRINKDWSLIAEFKSGSGEKIDIFPVEVLNMRTGIKLIALQVDLKVKTAASTAPLLGALNGIASGGGGVSSFAALGPAALSAMVNDGVASSWIDYDEINNFIEFIQFAIVPNLDKKFKKKSSEFIFRSNEITLRFLVDESNRRITFLLNNGEGNAPIVFFTESKVDKIAELIPILQKVKSKELNFDMP